MPWSCYYWPHEMDQVTQQNAALVEQASAAAEAMQSQAGQLVQVVSVFRLGGVQVVGQCGGIAQLV